ncbi:hypothetical protein IBX73_04005 [candidate division WOR-3 bacterium]|nr:hypothetical protein [candidate division WOR-3 bacterium]
MRQRAILLLLLSMFFITVFNCATEEEPLICHLYGYVVRNDNQTGINNLVLKIYDINPYDLNIGRLRETTTRVQDSIDGFFEMDSVYYGTTKRQGNLVTIGIDSTQNPGYPSQYYTPFIDGEIDTVIISIVVSD